MHSKIQFGSRLKILIIFLLRLMLKLVCSPQPHVSREQREAAHLTSGWEEAAYPGIRRERAEIPREKSYVQIMTFTLCQCFLRTNKTKINQKQKPQHLQLEIWVRFTLQEKSKAPWPSQAQIEGCQR